MEAQNGKWRVAEGKGSHRQREDKVMDNVTDKVNLLWRRFAREFIGGVGGVVEERGDDRRALLEIVRRNAVEDVFVRVMRTAAVIERILNELKTGQADAVKGLMVSAAGIVERKGLR